MEVLLRYFLPVYLIAYFFAAFFWRSFMVWKKTGVNPVVFKGSDDAHDFIGRIFELLFCWLKLIWANPGVSASIKSIVQTWRGYKNYQATIFNG